MREQLILKWGMALVLLIPLLQTQACTVTTEEQGKALVDPGTEKAQAHLILEVFKISTNLICHQEI